MDYDSPFWGPTAISMLAETHGALTCRSATSQFGPILARFLNYYSLFWGPEAISIVVKSQGTLTCQSSKFIVLADFGPFHGLLLTVLGSKSDFHGC